jgi:hypothetical protein
VQIKKVEIEKKIYNTRERERERERERDDNADMPKGGTRDRCCV